MLRELTGLLSKIRSKGSFARNISIASSWNLIGILIQFLLSPIVTRLYTPAEYGVFAIFNSIVLNVSMIITFKYSDAIIIAPSQKQRNNAILLSSVITFGLSFISLIVILFFQKQLINFIGDSWFSGWFYLMPLSIFLTGIIEVLLFVNIRRNKFFLNGFSGFLLNLSSRGYAIIHANVSAAKAKGLIGGDVVGKTFAVCALLSSLFSPKKVKEFYNSVDQKSMIVVAKIYKHFPIYSLPSNILSSLSSHIPIYLLQVQYSSSVVGAFALASSMLELINRLIPYSISSALLPKAIEMKRESLSVLAKGTFRLFSFMSFASFFIFGCLALMGKMIFPLFFGEDWRIAGSFASLLTLSYGLNFISLSISEVYKVINKQRLFLILTVITVILKISAIFVSIDLRLDENTALWVYSVAGAFGSLVQSIVLFFKLKYKTLEVSLILLLLTACLFVTGWLVNF